MSRRRCILHCERKYPLYGLPKEDEEKNQWLRFIFNTVPQQYSPNLVLCSLHFTEDCFLNRAQFCAGFSRRLLLKDGAIPTLMSPPEDSPAPIYECRVNANCQVSPLVRHVASQTDPPDFDFPKTRSVSTQLSMKTLQNHIRSTATQVKVTSRDCSVCTVTLPLNSPMLFLQPTLVKKPTKRPRLSLTDGEEGPSRYSMSTVVYKSEDST
ncbi:uncharacterized protein LOC121641607 [Melanotaenia boesemani]|uniref:uncharacterized protein LOC121641607 n=1 Tax=Melanotaenia boesemani TaxID=1250792 RepID=UPI001C04CC79|nr:uncharacterized protein LOC121641607 [Melanotaenia boesemani]